jgi:hypothetical protein
VLSTMTNEHGQLLVVKRTVLRIISFELFTILKRVGCARECSLQRRGDAKNREVKRVIFAKPSVFAPLRLTHPPPTPYGPLIINH